MTSPPYLRTQSDARFTTTGAKMSNSELDDNWIYLHDLIDALEAQVELSQGAVSYGIQEMSSSDNWNGESPLIEVDTNAAPVTVTIPTALIVAGNRVTIYDAYGNASVNNITVQGAASEKIDGATSATISTNYGHLTLQCTSVTTNTKMVSL